MRTTKKPEPFITTPPTPPTERIRINVNEIPQYVTDGFCRVLYPAMTEFFKRPGVDAEFKRWKKERKRQARA